MDVVGLAASIATLLNVGYVLVSRIQEFQGSNSPFCDIAVCLPLLLRKIEEIETCCLRSGNGSGSLLDPSQDANKVKMEALARVVEGCKRNIDRLSCIISSLSITATDARPGRKRLKITLSAIKSLHKDKEVRRLQQVLQSYESTLSFFFMDMKPCIGTIEAKEDIPLYLVPPFATDRFVGRKDLLGQIQERLRYQPGASRYDRTAVLVGLGGQGKTQLAFEYCRFVKSTHAVIYLCALSPWTIRRSFGRLAASLLHKTVDTSSDAHVAEIYRYLERRHAPLLVVLDNFDCPKNFDNISLYLPRSENATILITTRNLSCSSLGRIIEVGSMEENDAVTMLLSHVGHQMLSKEEEAIMYDTASAIVRELGLLPLAINQAAAYIRARNLPYSAFLEHYTRRRGYILRQVPEIWNYSRQAAAIDEKNRLSAFTTWELSFSELGEDDEERQRHGHLLTLAAFVDHTRVSQVFYQANAKVSKGNPQKVHPWDPLEHQDLVALWRNVSLVYNVQLTDTHVSFSLHPLVGQWLRERISPEKRIEYQQEVMDTLAEFSKGWIASGAVVDPLSLHEMLAHIYRVYNADGKQELVYGTQLARLRLKDAPSDVYHFYRRNSSSNVTDTLSQGVFDH